MNPHAVLTIIVRNEKKADPLKLYEGNAHIVLALTLHKGLTKTVVRPAGVPTAPFAVIEQIADLQNLQLPFPLFAKPIAEGTGKGVTPASKVRDAAELRTTCDQLLRQFQQPVLVETFLPGREFTIGMLGTGDAAYALGTLEIVLLASAEAEVYSAGEERFEGAEVFRDDERRVVRQHDSARTDADGFCSAGDVGDGYGGGGARDAGHVVVFGQPETMVAGSFCVLSKVEAVAQCVGGG